MNTGSKALDEMLSFQKTASDRTGLGYQGSNSKSQKNAGKRVFVKAKPIDPLPQLKKKKVQFTPICHNCEIVDHIRPNCHKLNRRSYSHESFVPICHHCGKKGHIRPHCYNLNSSQKKVNENFMKKYKVKFVEKIVKPKTKSV